MQLFGTDFTQSEGFQDRKPLYADTTSFHLPALCTYILSYNNQTVFKSSYSWRIPFLQNLYLAF